MGKKKAAAGDSAKGEKLFKNLCAICHSMSANGTGPALKGAFGSAPQHAEGGQGHGVSPREGKRPGPKARGVLVPGTGLEPVRGLPPSGF